MQEVYLQECPVMNCHYKCNFKKIMDSNLARQHGEIEEKFPCSQCKKEFDSEYQHDHHEEKGMCTKKKVWCCTDCVRSFKTSVEMNHHRARVHTLEESMVVCNYCQSELANTGALINHCKIIHPRRSWHLEDCMQRAQREEEEGGEDDQ